MPKITDPTLLRELGAPRQAGMVLTDPYKPREADRADAQLAVSQGQLGISGGNLAVSQANAARDAARQAALLPADARKAEADARKAEIEANRAEVEAAKAPKPGAALIQQTLAASSLMDAIGAARRQIGAGYSTGNFFGGGRFSGIPIAGQNATDLAATLDGLKGRVLTDTLAQMKAQSSSGASGMGSLTEKEGDRLAASIGALQQGQRGEELLRNLAKVERHYRNMLALSNGDDPQLPEVQEKYGIISKQGDNKAALLPVSGEGGGLTTEGSFKGDPGLSGVNATVQDMIKSGREPTEIRAYLNRVSPGLGDKATNIEQAVQFTRQNPNNPAQVDLEKNWVPASGAMKAIGDSAMSPFGAAALGVADMASFGTIDNLTSNPDATRAMMLGSQQQNPMSYMLGQVGGGVGAALGLEAGLGRAGLQGIGRSRVADALLGAGYSAGSADAPDDNRVSSALLGGVTGVAGGMAGRGVARVAGRLGAGVQDAARVALDRAGVRMTPGQLLGGGIQRTEDRLAGLPLVGDQIGARRMEGVRDFNRAAMGEAVAPIGGQAPDNIGFQGVQQNQGAVSQAYSDALGGVNLTSDPQFGTDLAAGLVDIGSVPRVGPEVYDSVGNIMSDPSYYPGGILPGENMQAIMQELRGLRSGYANDPLGNRVGEGVRSVEDALSGLVERQSPGTMDAYRSADAAYRGQSIIDDAVLKGQQQGGVFTPAQLGQSMKANVKAYGGKRAAARGNMPFQDLQQAGQEVLPSSIPDSGTAGRMVIPAVAAMLGGGGTAVASEDGSRASNGLGGATVAALLASAPYSAGARNVLQRSLIGERPDLLRRAGEQLLENQRIAGLLASPIAIGSVTQ